MKKQSKKMNMERKPFAVTGNLPVNRKIAQLADKFNVKTYRTLTKPGLETTTPEFLECLEQESPWNRRSKNEHVPLVAGPCQESAGINRYDCRPRHSRGVFDC